ncbi:hypothetical protein [Saccharopolyspora flava]|uniref:hypothetical protein n=1 Tax=Saccharopolyspora flava TaxID=95161 RepID=UPI000B855EDF|nr:hypothetical protein [Saccharopolyspora flava]
MRTFSNEEVNQVAGELLPERAVLSVVPIVGNGGGAAGGPAYGGGVDHGTTALSACHAHTAEGTPGLLGSLGLGSNNPSDGMTCAPAAVSGH